MRSLHAVLTATGLALAACSTSDSGSGTNAPPAGTCTNAEVIATGVAKPFAAGGLLATDTDVFVVDFDVGAGSILKLPADGGALQPVAKGLRSPQHLTEAGGALYFTSGSTLASVPLGGEGATIHFDGGFFAAPRWPALDGGRAFYLAEDGIVSRPIAGGNGTKLLSATDRANDDVPLALDATHVYFLRKDTNGKTTHVAKVSHVGGAALQLAPVESSDYPPGGYRRSLVADDASVYWVAGRGTEIWSVPKAGGAATKLWSSSKHAMDLAVDSAFVYAIVDDDSGGSVIKIPRNGGAEEAVARCTSPIDALSIRGTKAYFVLHDGTVMRAWK